MLPVRSQSLQTSVFHLGSVCCDAQGSQGVLVLKVLLKELPPWRSSPEKPPTSKSIVKEVGYTHGKSKEWTVKHLLWDISWEDINKYLFTRVSHKPQTKEMVPSKTSLAKPRVYFRAWMLVLTEVWWVQGNRTVEEPTPAQLRTRKSCIPRAPLQPASHRPHESSLSQNCSLPK